MSQISWQPWPHIVSCPRNPGLISESSKEKGQFLRPNLGKFEAILAQRRHSGKKKYSIHEPDVQCISKGKEHKKYEFGNKVSIIRSSMGIILGAQSFRNESDGHTIEASLAQVERLTQRKIKNYCCPVKLLEMG